MRVAFGWSVALRALWLPLSLAAALDEDQSAPPPEEVKQVAIIGAGAAGSSAAYHLHRFATEDGVPINITIFEKTDHIGGRTLTVDAYDNPLEKVELGASIFIKANHILWNSSKEFGLPLKEPYGDADELMVVWDGDKFVYEQATNSWWWWDLTKMFWKYGMAPYRTQKLMQATIGTFLKLYQAPYFPFRSLTLRAFELELTKITGQTGEQFLAQNSVSNHGHPRIPPHADFRPQITELFSHDIIQASTRVNYASNLAKIHGLDTMVSMAPEGAVSVSGGNWQIFDIMVQKTNATVYRNTSVSSIELAPKAPGSLQAKYIIGTTDPGSSTGTEEQNAVVFDNVIIANPYQFSNITTRGDVIQHAIDKIPYVQLHVTLFASPFRLNAGFFNLTAGAKVPTTVLTTLGPGDNATSGISGAGKTGFFSISTLRTITNPTTLKEEYLYKIFSPAELTPAFLSSLLGVDVPDTFISPVDETPEGGSHVVDPISWYYPHVFYSYPKAFPRVTFQDPILRAGLYYTSGIESFISTMETSALMGKNVARLIVDDFLGLSTGHAVNDGRPQVVAEEEDQRILGQEDGGIPSVTSIDGGPGEL